MAGYKKNRWRCDNYRIRVVIADAPFFAEHLLFYNIYINLLFQPFRLLHKDITFWILPIQIFLHSLYPDLSENLLCMMYLRHILFALLRLIIPILLFFFFAKIKMFIISQNGIFYIIPFRYNVVKENKKLWD